MLLIVPFATALAQAPAAGGATADVMPQLEAWQTLEHACDAYFDETGIRSWPTGFTLQIRVPNWQNRLKVTLKSTRSKFTMGQVWNAQLLEQTDEQLTFQLNNDAGGIVGDKEHNNEFGFMGATPGDHPYEKGDLSIAVDDECRAILPQPPSPAPSPTAPPTAARPPFPRGE